MAKRTTRQAQAYDRKFFKSQRYLRASDLMGIHPFRNPNYKEELKRAGLWWKPRSEANRR